MTLAMQFSERINDAMRQAQDLGYNPTRIRNMLQETNAVSLAKSLVKSPDLHDGLIAMKKLGRLDLTVEHIMSEPQFAPLFNEVDHAWVKLRLELLNK